MTNDPARRASLLSSSLLAALLVAGPVVGSVVGPTSSASAAPVSGGTAAASSVAGKASPAAAYRAAVLRATNRHRLAHDRVALRKQACVQRFAQRQANRMARQQRLFHQDLGPVLQECGLSSVGENVAYGYPSGTKVVGGWMRSSGHRANILNPRFRLLGVGATERRGTWYAVQVFGRR